MDGQTDRLRVLILGGTREGRLLAEALAGAGLEVIYALLSPTGKAKPPENCSLHVGSFGGREGLKTFIQDQGIGFFVNALHPHAIVMQRRALSLSFELKIPCFRFERETWRPLPGDRWQSFDWVEDLSDAVRVAGYKRLFFAVGPGAIRLFHPLSQNRTLFARRFDAMRGGDMDFVQWIDGAPNASEAEEIELLQSRNIEALVSKNSGGLRPAKLDAAAKLGLPVLLLNPSPLAGPSFSQWPDILEAILSVAETS